MTADDLAKIESEGFWDPLPRLFVGSSTLAAKTGGGDDGTQGSASVDAQGNVTAGDIVLTPVVPSKAIPNIGFDFGGRAPIGPPSQS